MEGSISFLADVHLGKLAKNLRMLGIDIFYRNDLTNVELLRIAQEEKRILLSRNIGFEKVQEIAFFWIESEDPPEQVKKVVDNFHLRSSFRPFSRCLLCNGLLESRKKEMIEPMLEENTKRFYNEFWQCTSCKKIYWKGSHYERMQQLLKQLAFV